MANHQRTFIGIDPGLKGALAFYTPRLSEFNCQYVSPRLFVFDMPLQKLPNQKFDLDIHHFIFLVNCYSSFDPPPLAIVEDVSAMTYTDSSGRKRGQGAAASFKFGRGAGALDAALIALGIPIKKIRPAVWKSLLNLSSDKGASIARAITLFPEAAAEFARKRDDGRAEAAILAHMGSERFK